MNGKKLITGLAVMAIFISSVIGAWILYADSSFVGHVTSTEGSPVVFVTELEDFTVDTTDDDTNGSTTATVSNSNGVLSVTVGINTTKTDVSDDCINFEDDCAVSVTIGGIQRQDGDVFDLYSGDHEVVGVISCVRLSCPQDITTTVTLSES